MTGKRSLLLQFVGLMNSKLFDWYLKLTTEAEVQGGGVQLYVTTLEKTLLKLDFDEKLNKGIESRIRGEISDEELDKLIFYLYKLTEEEGDYILSWK